MATTIIVIIMFIFVIEKKYLEDKGVHQQIETSKEEILFLDVESSFPLGIIHKIRVKLQKSLKLYPFSNCPNVNV